MQEKTLKFSAAFKRIRNIASLELKTSKEVIYLWLPRDPAEVATGDGFARDMSTQRHLGTGEVQVQLRTLEDLECAKPRIEKSFEGRWRWPARSNASSRTTSSLP